MKHINTLLDAGESIMKFTMSIKIDREMYNAYIETFKRITKAMGDREYNVPKGTIKAKVSNKWNNLLYLCHLTDELDIEVEYECDPEYIQAWSDLIVKSVNILTQFKGLSEEFKNFLDMSIADTSEVETNKL
tara:strand:+ start:63 stop:458 length:396 start_codon:yes stop_codon:yes gene_type:complete